MHRTVDSGAAWPVESGSAQLPGAHRGGAEDPVDAGGVRDGKRADRSDGPVISAAGTTGADIQVPRQASDGAPLISGRPWRPRLQIPVSIPVYLSATVTEAPLPIPPKIAIATPLSVPAPVAVPAPLSIAVPVVLPAAL